MTSDSLETDQLIRGSHLLIKWRYPLKPPQCPLLRGNELGLGVPVQGGQTCLKRCQQGTDSQTSLQGQERKAGKAFLPWQVEFRDPAHQAFLRGLGTWQQQAMCLPTSSHSNSTWPEVPQLSKHHDLLLFYHIFRIFTGLTQCPRFCSELLSVHSLGGGSVFTKCSLYIFCLFFCVLIAPHSSNPVLVLTPPKRWQSHDLHLERNSLQVKNLSQV